MAITKVWLDESNDECVSCGACEATCDAVFEVPEKMKVKVRTATMIPMAAILKIRSTSTTFPRFRL